MIHEMPRNSFKHAITAGEVQIGLWCSLASHVSVEVVAGAGFDWLLLDTEHSANELPMVHTQLLATMGSASHPVVRVPWNDFVTIKRYLDIGTQSFLVPYVQNAEEARAAVRATRYPPNGIRGVATVSRASRFGRVRDYFDHADEEVCVVVQLESREALDNLEAIAAVEGVDGLFIGPSDLSADLGHLGHPGHPEVRDAIEDAFRRIQGCGKAAGFLTPDAALAKRWLDQGCLIAAVGADIGLLARGAEALRERFADR